MTTEYFVDTGRRCDPIDNCPTRHNGCIVCRCEHVLSGNLDIVDAHVESLQAGTAPLAERVDALRRLRAAAVERLRPVIFQVGSFTLASGAKSNWKIECGSLTKADWAGLAAMAAEILPPFREVRGVPRGGVPFADALRRYVTQGPVLVAEDVVTTGGSMERFAAAECGNWPGSPERIGVCVFARGPVPDWVTPLFRMPSAGR